MCRNIRTLFNFEPPATDDEVRASALQFVRKLSGFNTPSQANAAAFDRAVGEVSEAARKLLASLHTHAPARDRAIDDVAAVARTLLDSLVTNAAPRDRDEWAARARARAAERYARP